MSGTWNRASGSPSRAGSAQAMALTSIARLGGKVHRTATARSLLEADQALLEEALAPPVFAFHYPRKVARDATISWDGVALALPRRQDGRSWAGRLVTLEEHLDSALAQMY